MGTPGAPAVVIAAADEPMPRLLHALVEAAAQRRPWMARQMRGSVALRSTDVPASATVSFQRARIVVRSGASAGAWIVIEADSQTLAALGGGGGLPAMRAGGARLHGLQRHPLFALCLWRLMVHGSGRA